MQSLHMIVSGKLQNTYAQGWIHEQAQELALKGWTRFIEDGKLEVLLQGNEENAKELSKRLKEKAPIPEIQGVKEEWIDYDKEYSEFEMRG